MRRARAVAGLVASPDVIDIQKFLDSDVIVQVWSSIESCLALGPDTSYTALETARARYGRRIM